jgi:hypothetical protein
MKIRSLLLFGAAAVLVSLPATAQWSDDFDSYPLGSLIDGQGGWAGWDGGAMNAVVSNAHAKYSGDQSVQLFANDDVVQEYEGYTTGQWTYTAWQWIPSDHTGIQTYFIMLNRYDWDDSVDRAWSLQFLFDYDTNLCRDVDDSASNQLPIVYDEWMEIRVDIDLDANTRDLYYGGNLVSSGFRWYNVDGTYDIQAIEAVDLWGDSGGDYVHYDDMSLVPEPASCLLLALAAVFGLRRR